MLMLIIDPVHIVREADERYVSMLVASLKNYHLLRKMLYVSSSPISSTEGILVLNHEGGGVTIALEPMLFQDCTTSQWVTALNSIPSQDHLSPPTTTFPPSLSDQFLSAIKLFKQLLIVSRVSHAPMTVNTSHGYGQGAETDSSFSEVVIISSRLHLIKDALLPAFKSLRENNVLVTIKSIVDPTADEEPQGILHELSSVCESFERVLFDPVSFDCMIKSMLKPVTVNSALTFPEDTNLENVQISLSFKIICAPPLTPFSAASLLCSNESTKSLLVLSKVPLETFDSALIVSPAIVLTPSVIRFDATYEEHNANRVVYNSLCDHLKKRGEGLIVSTTAVDHSTTTDTFSKRSNKLNLSSSGGGGGKREKPTSSALKEYYIVTSDSNVNCLIMFKVASMESMRQVPIHSAIIPIQSAILSSLDAAFDKVNTSPYNPMMHKCGLYDVVAAQMTDKKKRRKE